MKLLLRKANAWLLGAFLLAYLSLLYPVHLQLREFAIHEAESQAMKFMMAYRAVRNVVSDLQKPTIFSLQEAGKLDPHFFSPQLLSSTYVGSAFIRNLNSQLTQGGQPPVYFKLAADNARNSVNLADVYENKMLDDFRSGLASELKGVEEIRGESYFFYATATAPMAKSCLRCHGDPDDAPRELVERYGRVRGFNHEIGDIRAVVSIRVPLAHYLDDAGKAFNVLALILALMLGLLFSIFGLFLRRLKQQKALIEAKNLELETLSTHDGLTQVYNRIGFRTAFDSIMSAAQRYGGRLSLIMLDLDGFKAINDEHGHEAGDRVLAESARRLQGELRRADLLGRWGGEEFVIALPESDRAQAMELAERLRLALQSEPLHGDIRVTASFGISENTEGDDLMSLLRRADSAMYQAKREGKNRVCSP